jgi:hypothetical protein
MKAKWVTQVFFLCAFAAVTAQCGERDLEDETEDVIEEQQEAAEAAARNPQDTARIRREGEDVEREQREAARKLRREVSEKLDTNYYSTTTRE